MLNITLQSLKTKAELGIIVIPAKAFKTKLDGLPCANIGYGFDNSTEHEFASDSKLRDYFTKRTVDKYDAGHYPTTITKNGPRKVSVSYVLPYACYFKSCIDDKTGREFIIERVQNPQFVNDPIGDSIYPTFAIKHNNIIVAYLTGESYHKD